MKRKKKRWKTDMLNGKSSMVQTKLPIQKYKYDIVVENDHVSQVVESFTNMEAAHKFIAALEKSGIDGRDIKIIVR